MNTSYNCTDFIGLSLDSDDDYEPYGYGAEALRAVEASREADAGPGIETMLFADSAQRYAHE